MRTVVVTGGCSGIGARIAAALTADYRVVVADLSAPAEPLPGVEYLQGDLSTEQDCARVAAAVDELHGLVHCAGIASFGRFQDMPRAEWERVLRVNVGGTIGILQALGPRLADGGRIVLFSSGTVFRGPGGAAVYASSKAAIIGLVHCLAEEFGERGITVNAIAPGMVLTPLSASIAGTEQVTIATRAIKRASTTDDYVDPVRFFLGEGAGFVTGQTLVVDGGTTRH